MLAVFAFDFHALRPFFANSVTAADGTRRLPGLISTQGSCPSRKSRQTVVRETPKASAACCIDKSRLSLGAVAPSIGSPDKMRSTRRSVSGVAASSRVILFSVVRVNMSHLVFVRAHHAPAW